MPMRAVAQGVAGQPRRAAPTIRTGTLPERLRINPQASHLNPLPRVQHMPYPTARPLEPQPRMRSLPTVPAGGGIRPGRTHCHRPHMQGSGACNAPAGGPGGRVPMGEARGAAPASTHEGVPSRTKGSRPHGRGVGRVTRTYARGGALAHERIALTRAGRSARNHPRGCPSTGKARAHLRGAQRPQPRARVCSSARKDHAHTGGARGAAPASTRV